MDPSEDPTTTRNTAFRMANKHQDELVKSGVSQSGHERNCCFLNTGSERFANISAAAGLDHIGDGRTYARVDWDHDGDLDLWSTNRTSPRAQFLRNNSDTENHFLALRLYGNGTTTNRDAIGARVEIKLAGDDRPLIKTLRAGEGFLAQSSKWVHFGLGTNDTVEHLIVRWPGGEAEEFTNLEADRLYTIVQGSGRAEVWSRPVTAVELEATENEGPLRSDLARIPLRFPIPLPTLQYKTFAGEQVSLDKYRGSPTLVNLWASWCQPCLAELVEFREHADELRSAGLTIVALSIDAVAEDTAANQDQAQSLWKKQKFPFQAGMADAALVQHIEVVLDFLFDHRRRWTVPTSFLLNSEGHLAAIYIGRVEIDALLSDVSVLQSDERAWSSSSMPFAGRWADERRLPDMWPLVERLFEENKSAEAVDYFTRLEKLQAPNEAFLGLLVQVGKALQEDGHVVQAEQRFEQAIEANPQNGAAHFLLGKLLVQRRKFEDATHHCRKAVRLRPQDSEAHFFLANLLDSQGDKEGALAHFQLTVEQLPSSSMARFALGKAFVAKQMWGKATEQLRQAVQLDTENAGICYHLARALQKSGHSQEAIPHYQRAVELKPNSGDYRYSLGAALADGGETRDAIKQLRQAHQLAPDSLKVMNGLAWIIATEQQTTAEEKAEAVRMAEKAAKKTKHSHPQILDTLAAAYAAAGQFEKAVQTARRAVARAKATKQDELSNEIGERLKLYRLGKPYRASRKLDPRT